MLKKIFLLFVIPFILCACKKTTVEEISFASWGSVTEVHILQKLIKDFEKENPNIKIKFIHIPQNYFQKIHLLFASNQAPDVLFINNLYLPIYAKYLQELNIKKENFYRQSYEALSYQGKLYAVPRDISNLVFYYNKDLFTPPENLSLQNFLPILDSINAKYKISYERDIYWAEPYILTLGYDEGIKFYKSLEGKYAPYPSQIGSATLAQMFINGDVALYLSGRWMYPKIKEKARFNWSVISFPGVTSADASGWAISKNTKHLKSSQIFVNFISSKKSIDYFTQTGLIVPARIDSSKNMENGNIFIDAISKSQPHIVDREYKKNRDRLNKELFN